MSSRPLIKPHTVINNVSMAADVISTVTIIDNLSMVSYAITWSGTTPVGLIAVEVSNDYTQNADGSVRNVGTWNALPLSVTPTISGDTGMGFIDIDANAGYALRLHYIRTSGIGTLNSIVAAKVA